MADDQMRSGANGSHGVSVRINDRTEDFDSGSSAGCCSISVSFIQKIIAETLGTYFLIFAGCGAVVVNIIKEKVVTLPGISIVWGLVVMVMVYSVGHMSGAHLNPAVTIAFATCKRFPWKQVPAYIGAQVVGSTLASGTLRLLFSGPHDRFAGTLPAGTDVQSLVVEFIITFYLMFVISGVATDNRAVTAIGELAGLAVGSTVSLNVMFAGDWGFAFPLVPLVETHVKHKLLGNFGGIYEFGKEFGPSDNIKPLYRHMDLPIGPHGRDKPLPLS